MGPGFESQPDHEDLVTVMLQGLFLFYSLRISIRINPVHTELAKDDSPNYKLISNR